MRLYAHGGLTPIFHRTVPGVEAVALWARYLALGSADGSVSLIDFAVQAQTYETTRNDAHEAVLALALSDGRLAAGSTNGKIYVYKTEYLVLVSVLSHSLEPIRALAWSSGQTLAAGGNDSTVRLYELAKTERVGFRPSSCFPFRQKPLQIFNNTCTASKPGAIRIL